MGTTVKARPCRGMAASTKQACANLTTNNNGMCGKCTGVPYQSGGVTSLPDEFGADTDPFGDIDGIDTDPDEPRTEFLIPEGNLAALEAKIAKLAKRADKLGVPAPTLEIVETLDLQDEETGMLFQHHRVKVSGESPHFDGWRMRAVVDLDPHDGGPNIVHTIGDVDADPAWRELGDVCDHCNLPGKGRHKIVVVEHDNGERARVGTSCLRDFLGHTSPAQIAAWAEVVSTLDDLAASYEHSSGAGEARYPTEEFLSWVAASIRRRGWLPRSKADPEADKIPTADAAVGDMDYYYRAKKKQWVDPGEPPTDEDRADAEAALEWAQELPEDVSSDYLWNLRAVANKSGWRHRDIGLAASIVATWRRETGKVADAQARRQAAIAAGHLGTPNGKETFEAEVESVRSYEGHYGVRRLVTMRTPQGHQVKWWASTSKVPTAGHTYAVAATVKDHGEYQGVPETTVQRPKFTEIESPCGSSPHGAHEWDDLGKGRRRCVFCGDERKG